MEERTEYTVNIDRSSKLLRLPADLLEWYKTEAIKNKRSANAEMLMALEAWQASKESKE